LLEAESGNPVTADSLKYGLRLVALAFPCNPQWRTPEGIALVGPRYFGYDADYQQYFLMLCSVASMQNCGAVVPQQSSTNTQS
jgi:hypothetical protein